MHSKLKALARIAALVILTAQTAGAAELQWTFDNETDVDISIEFYSQDRDQVWPGGDQVYILGPTESRTYDLSCNQGENICYGGWIAGDDSTQWGSGYNDQQTCETCCAICGGGNAEPVDLIR